MNGIINVYKEKGYTSHDVVAKLRGILHQKKIGHTGTLDPDAEGVLPVCLGKGTKVCELLTDKDKTYVAELLLGVETDTLDTSGRVLARHEVSVSEKEAVAAVESFLGTIQQIPHMYSALKVGGKKVKVPVIRFEVTCSKGTYVRSLCRDIGEKLGCGGCMQELLRTRVERFCVEDSLKLEQIQRLAEEGRAEDIVLPVDEMFDDCEKVVVQPKDDGPVHNGNAVGSGVRKPQKDKERIRLYDSEGHFVGLYEWNAERQKYVPLKMFWDGKA